VGEIVLGREGEIVVVVEEVDVGTDVDWSLNDLTWPRTDN
jgi:hypothetical protein